MSVEEALPIACLWLWSLYEAKFSVPGSESRCDPEKAFQLPGEDSLVILIYSLEGVIG